jgi:uncharacterized protein
MSRWKKRLLVLTAISIVLLLGASLGRFELYRLWRGLPPYSHSPGTVTVEQVAMRDGVHLRTEIHRPKEVKQAPVVLVRNPYDARFVFRIICETLVRYGYACVLQDVRGLLDSEGEWVPFENERNDGLDTLAWLDTQPFQNHKVALMGPSYLAATQWLMADAFPPQVKTFVPQVFGTNLYEPAYERGLFRHEISTAWATLMPSRGMRFREGRAYLEAAKQRPHEGADEKYMTKKLAWYRDWLANQNPGDALWRSEGNLRTLTTPERVRIPALLIGGWFDPFLSSQLEAWSRLATKNESVFIIGPYNHLGFLADGIEGAADAKGGLEQWPLMLEWLGHHLRDEPFKTLKPGTLRLRSVGKSGWDTVRAFPDVKPTQIEWSLGGQIGATCERSLMTQPQDGVPAAPYIYDPMNPRPTQGGAALLAFSFFRSEGIPPGAGKQDAPCARSDVLTWTSDPMQSAMLVSGPAHLSLRVKSNVDDTAFIARLIESDALGAHLMREDATTLLLPTRQTQSPVAYSPGSARDVEIDFWPLRWELSAGSRVRLDVSSSSFPAYAVHSNFAGRWAEQAETRSAEQTIISGTLKVPLAEGTPCPNGATCLTP